MKLYREHECIWNISTHSSKNKQMRDAAYEEIVKKLSKENCGVPELKCHIVSRMNF